MHAGLALDLLITRQAGNIPPLIYVFSLADRQGASIEEVLLVLQPSVVSLRACSNTVGDIKFLLLAPVTLDVSKKSAFP